MHIVLIAYEFSPSPAPQALRWIYLANEMCRRGHRIDVVTIHLGGGTPGLPALEPEVNVLRTYAGPVRGTLARLRDRRQRTASSSTGSSTRVPAGEHVEARTARNWKQGLSERVQAIAARFIYPDVRGEWLPWGRKLLESHLDQARPDLIIASHEPATSLQLALLAKDRKIPWIADLGDPVLAPYTPARWEETAWKVEKETCRNAGQLLVTNPSAKRLLEQRHGCGEKTTVITQGFCARSARHHPESPILYDPARLELLYTGSFYQFRSPTALLEALARHPLARLSIAAITVPPALIEAQQRMPSQIRLLGFLPHSEARALQRSADILVNISNQDVNQVPGKFYEYLGSQRPILHLSDGEDSITPLLARLQRGWMCQNECESIDRWLQGAILAKANGLLGHGLDLGLAGVMDYSWESLAGQLEATALRLLRQPCNT